MRPGPHRLRTGGAAPRPVGAHGTAGESGAKVGPAGVRHAGRDTRGAGASVSGLSPPRPRRTPPGSLPMPRAGPLSPAHPDPTGSQAAPLLGRGPAGRGFARPRAGPRASEGLGERGAHPPSLLGSLALVIDSRKQEKKYFAFLQKKLPLPNEKVISQAVGLDATALHYPEETHGRPDVRDPFGPSQFPQQRGAPRAPCPRQPGAAAKGTLDRRPGTMAPAPPTNRTLRGRGSPPGRH